MSSLIIYFLVITLAMLIINIGWKIGKEKWAENGGLWFNRDIDDLFKS